LSCQRKHFELLYEPYQTIGLDFVRISRAYLQSSHHSSRSLPTDHSNHNNNGNGDSNNGNNDNRNTNQNNNRQICRSEFRRQSMTQLVLKANYQRCSGIVSLDLEDGTLHTITIDYYTSANHVNRSFTITCFVPNKELDLASIPFRMSLWNGNKQIQNLQQATLRIGDQLNARLEANAHFSYPVALNAYPVSCHTAQPGGKARAEVVREGCPSMNDPAGRSLRLVQNISNLGSIQMRFTINERLMPWTKST
uniref:GAE domain-containing protein n=1 Tax=Anisakis simplex TaxID=6269 RepID=A0A0M3J1L5_ANISI